MMVVAIGASVAFVSCNKTNSSAPGAGGDSSKMTAASMSPVERGKYLVTIASCNDCHTPWKMGPKGPEQDMSRMLSGHPEGMPMPPAPQNGMPWAVSGAITLTAWSGPFGTSFTANLTPDSATGLGKMTEADFIKTLRTGLMYPSNRPIMPPMPVEYVKQMTDDDLKAVYAYLRSIPPVKNKVPDYIPPAGAGMPPGAPPAH
ncbi:MAG TPA: c-type cytochrome [Candidatus Kapabacteria bacterium]|nr:c-type cytochrome [Candidatus Kapabacteria bacterium]